MTISISAPNGHRLAEVRCLKVDGLPGVGTYIMVITLEMSVWAPPAETLLRNLKIRVESNDAMGRAIVGWGELNDQASIRLTQYTNECAPQFLLQLTPLEIETIENRRNGGDLKLSIWLSGETDQAGKTNPITGTSEYIVPMQEWLKALGLMRYQDVLLFGLPLPPSTDNKPNPLKDILAKAREHILKGHYDEAVTSCRQVIECVEQQRGDKEVASQVVGKYRQDRKDMDAHERLLLLREILKHATHLGPHYSGSSGTFSRDQAQAILGATISLLSLSVCDVI